MDTSSQIKNFILDNLSKHKKDIINTSIQKFGISRQAMLKHMRTLIEEKEVIAHGKTKDRYYEHRPKINFNKEIKNLKVLFQPTIRFWNLYYQILDI